MKSKVKIPVEKGALPGYTLKKSLKDRRMVLVKLSKKTSWGRVVKQLNVLYIYNKNKHPETALKFRRDMKYIQNYFKKSPRKSVRKSTRKSRKSVKKSTRKSRKSVRKSTRKSRKSVRKSTRKSRK